MHRFIVTVAPEGILPPRITHTFRLDPPHGAEDYAAAWAVCEVRSRLQEGRAGTRPSVHNVEFETIEDGLWTANCRIFLGPEATQQTYVVITVCDMRTEVGRDAADFMGVTVEEPA